MTPSEDLQPKGDKIRKAILWACDVILNCPDKKREDVIREAEIRFDLSPKECVFLDEKIAKVDKEHPCK